MFSVFSHVDTKPSLPATVVMSTGTGKTDTIFALIIAGFFRRTLMVIHSNAFRTQIGDRLTSLQRPQAINAISENILSPIVHRIHGRHSAVNSRAIGASNVTIATLASLVQLDDAEPDGLAAHFAQVVLSEAHHVAAMTWGVICEQIRIPTI